MRTVDDILRQFPIPRTVHRMPEPREASFVARLLEPGVVLEVRVERVAEGRRGVLPLVVEQPVREVRHDLEGFVAAVVEASVDPSDHVGGEDSRSRAVCGYAVGCIVLCSRAGL